MNLNELIDDLIEARDHCKSVGFAPEGVQITASVSFDDGDDGARVFANYESINGYIGTRCNELVLLFTGGTLNTDAFRLFKCGCRESIRAVEYAKKGKKK